MMQEAGPAVQRQTIDSPRPVHNFHPDFAHPEADVVLVAKDAKCSFRVSSYTLKTTSGFFKDMFSLPQSDLSLREDVPVFMEEDATVLEHILRMICGLPLLEIHTHALLSSLLYAAEKYDMPGAMSRLRLYASVPSPLHDDPIRLYGCARRFNWQEEAKAFSYHTLKLNLNDSENRPALITLTAESLLDLIQLRRNRQEDLRSRLNNQPFVAGDTAHCIQCSTAISYQTWKELKNRILLEVDKRPLADMVIEPGLSTWTEAQTAWRASCPKPDCKRLLYDRAETVRVIRECIDALPKTIE